jgi:hypothetical protein
MMKFLQVRPKSNAIESKLGTSLKWWGWVIFCNIKAMVGELKGTFPFRMLFKALKAYVRVKPNKPKC